MCLRILCTHGQALLMQTDVDLLQNQPTASLICRFKEHDEHPPKLISSHVNLLRLHFKLADGHFSWIVGCIFDSMLKVKALGAGCKHRQKCPTAAVGPCCVFFFLVCFNLLMDDDVSHWLRLTCLWVILTVTEGGRGVDVRHISQTPSWWWMERSSTPCRRPHSTAIVNDKLHTCLSLFNEHQVPRVRLCARVQASGREIAKKIGWSFCYNLNLALHRSHPRQHSHTYTVTRAHSHIHLHTYCLPRIEPMQLFLALLLYPRPYLPPRWLRAGTRAATGTDMNKAVIIKTTHQKQYEL